MYLYFVQFNKEAPESANFPLEICIEKHTYFRCNGAQESLKIHVLHGNVFQNHLLAQALQGIE